MTKNINEIIRYINDKYTKEEVEIILPKYKDFNNSSLKSVIIKSLSDIKDIALLKYLICNYENWLKLNIWIMHEEVRCLFPKGIDLFSLTNVRRKELFNLLNKCEKTS